MQLKFHESSLTLFSGGSSPSPPGVPDPPIGGEGKERSSWGEAIQAGKGFQK